MFWWKPGILIPDLYLYGIKIQTNIKQNSVEKYAGKSQIFINIFLNFFYGVGSGPIILGWGGAVQLSKQWRSPPLFTQNSGGGNWRRRSGEGGRRRKRGGLAVALRRWCWRLLTGEWLGRWLVLLLLFCIFFFCASPLCFCFLLLFLMVQVLLSTTRRTMAAGGGSSGGYVDSRRWFFVLSLLFPLFFLSVFWFLISVLFYFSSLSLVLLAVAHGAANGEWEEADNGSWWLLQWRTVFATFFFFFFLVQGHQPLFCFSSSSASVCSSLCQKFPFFLAV